MLMGVVFITVGGVRFEWQAFQVHSTVDASKQKKKKKKLNQSANAEFGSLCGFLRYRTTSPIVSRFPGGRKSYINNLSRLQWCFCITNATFSLVSTFTRW